VLGVKLAGLSFASMEKLGYYKVTRIWFLRIYSSRDYKKENQVVGYGNN
jgi:regulator of sigma E protease